MLQKKHRCRRLVETAVLAAAVLLGVIWLSVYLTGQKKAAEPKKIIFVSKIIDNKSDFWVQLLEGARMAASEYGVEIEIVGAVSETDVKEQNRLIEWALGEKPDAIVLIPASYSETAPAVQTIRNSAIPLVLVDSAVEGGEDLPLVATDNVAAGRLQGEYMREFLTEDSRIVLISHVKASSTAREREQGIREGLLEYEDNIAEVVFCNSDYDKAYELMKGLLEKYPDIDMMAGLNEYSAVGAARAIMDSGLEEQIHMIGFDSSLEEIKLLERGIFEGIVIQNPFTMGYLAVEQACRILEGKEAELLVDSGSKLITREELHSEENQKLLFMFTED